MTQHSTPNEIHPELLSVCSMNSFHQHGSASRNYMFANHLGQMLVLNGSDERTIQSGVEREFGKYTFKIEMPCDGEIIEVIERYRKGLGKDSINDNPETIVVYENVHTKQIGMVRLVPYCSNHQYFGFKYKTKEGIQSIRQGAFISKGTVFLDSPSITDEGGYKYGVQANVAYMTHPATSEDGILISKDFLPRLGFKTYETRVVEWGNDKYALNLYGDEKTYKSFPDIGEYIRDDGLLMALRADTPIELAVVEKSIEDTMNVDFTFDTTVYANGPGGKIVDIKIHHDLTNNNYAEVHMDEQSQKYDEARRSFCKRIVDLWKRLYKQRGDALQLTPEFNRLIVESHSVVNEGIGQKVIKLYRQAPLDNFRVEFVIEYDIVPSVGFKLTDCHGG
jgi:hypothetical protein